jgi:hypothetical protein
LTEAGRCPVCLARFRGARVCSRCGADLEPLMILAVKSWGLRAAARAAIGAGQFEQALDLAMQAQEAQRTPAGEALRVVSELLGSAGGLAAGVLCAPDGRLLDASYPSPDDMGEVEEREGLRL